MKIVHGRFYIFAKNFANFFEKEYGESIEEQNLSAVQLFENMNLIQVNKSSNEVALNYAGALLFAKNLKLNYLFF